MSEYTDKIAAFAEAMDRKLEKNKHKGNWDTDNLPLYLAKLRAETAELEAEIIFYVMQGTNIDALVEECIDVANFALIIHDVAQRIHNQAGA